jgi:serine phosphatase RsbU (regulator of sigma subunit)
VVTGTKSLFQTFADAPSITDSLTVMSRSLKGMNLPRMGMAMTLLRVANGTTCTVSSAGMPPVMVYRSEAGEVEEIELSGYPLGVEGRPQDDDITLVVLKVAPDL